MSKEPGSFKQFLARKNVVFSAKRYGIDALGAMATGTLCLPSEMARSFPH